ncbi:MAG: GAF domain-containing sensor histidine kinase [Vicinamibacterales bacterium]|nr:GAF domain-containing sensor histidine kinase [Vicinamibacterales bacterium]
MPGPGRSPGASTVDHVSAAVPNDSEQPFSAEETRALETINRKIAAAESLESLIDFLFVSIQPVLACDRIGVSFVEDDGSRLVAHDARASYEPVLLKKGYAEDLAGSSLAQVLSSGTPRIISDLERYAAERPASQATTILLREGVRSSLTCPLVVEGRIVGVLFFSSRRPSAYGARDVRLHLAVAERLSQAVEKAWRIERLAQANQAYFEMLGFVSHELKSPLASIVMDTRVLQDGYLGEVPVQQADVLRKITRKADYLLNLIREYLDLARIEGGELAAHPRAGVDFVTEIVDTALDIVSPQAVEKKMRVERMVPAEPVRVACDPDLLRIVAVNLISNAVKYGRDEGTVRVTVEHASHRVGLRVWNEGAGFPASQRSRLFRKFSRLDTPELRARKGTGVGLYTSWRIVQLHGGRMSADSREGEWAEFCADIPQPLPVAVA